MTIMTKLAPPLRVDCPRDRWKRPILIDPNDPIQKAVTYQRVTTLAGMIDDTYALTNWKMRQVAKGVAWRDDIRIAVATTKDDDSDGKRELDALCERAMDAAGAGAGASMGTAFHRVCQIAQAYPDVDPASYCPPELRGELAAYRALVVEWGLAMSIDHQERTGICPELGVAGTWDDLAAGGPSCGCGRFHVVDKKSGQREFEYGQGKVSAQLSIYARFTSLWLATGNGYEAPPEICPEVGYVISVPIGRPDDACVYPVDLVKGWERAKLAVEIREARAVKRGLFGAPLGLPGLTTGVSALGVSDDTTHTNDAPKPKRTRRTKAQIAADAAAAEVNLRAIGDKRGADEAAHVHAMAIIDGAYDDETDAAVSERRANEPVLDTGQPFLMNGELKPGPAEVPFCPFASRPCTSGCPSNAERACVNGERDEDHDRAVSILETKLGAEVVRPTPEQLEAERVAALAGLRNGTTAQSELAKVAGVVVDEAQALRTAIEVAKGQADLETAYTLWSAHWTPEHDHMAVRRLISLTGTRDGMTRIWEQYQTVWTDDLTAAGEARLHELATAGIPT